MNFQPYKPYVSERGRYVVHVAQIPGWPKELGCSDTCEVWWTPGDDPRLQGHSLFHLACVNEVRPKAYQAAWRAATKFFASFF